jgi:hypothetical protein
MVDGSNLIFIVMPIVILICMFTGVGPTLSAGSHSPSQPWDADKPGRPGRPGSGRTPIRHHLIRAAVRFLLLMRRR